MEKNNINFSFKTVRLFSYFSPLVMITVSMLSVSKAGTRFPNRPSHLFERFRCNQNQHLNNNLSVIDATVGRFFFPKFPYIKHFSFICLKENVHCTHLRALIELISKGA